MMTRRDLLILPPMAALALEVPAAMGALPPVAGCCLRAPIDAMGFRPNGMVSSTGAEGKLITSSGDADLDRHLGRALVRLARQFKVFPGFGFFDDTGGENAYASPEQKVAETRGTVIFGLQLFKKTMSRFDDAGMAVLAVCAHEFAHIHQFWSGYYDKLTRPPQTNVRLAELQADYLAGYFLSLRKAERADLDIQGAGALFESLGDTEFTAREHHGTPEQRVRAIEAGYRFGKDTPAEIEQAAAAGEEFVMKEFA